MKRPTGYVTMQRERPQVTIDGCSHALGLPEDCIGVQYIFKTKKAARAWSGNKVQLKPVYDVVLPEKKS